MKEYDEQDALNAIKELIGSERYDNIGEDMIYEIIDLTFDYYDTIDDDGEIPEVETDDNGRVVATESLAPIYRFVEKALVKSTPAGEAPDSADVRDVVNAELTYELSLDE